MRCVDNGGRPLAGPWCAAAIRAALMPHMPLNGGLPQQERGKKMELSSGVKKIACVVIGAAFLIFGYQDYSKNKSLHKRGVAAVVEPISKYTERSRKGSTTYTAEFDFTTASGQKVHKSSSFPKAALDDFQAGKPVKVFYDERNPYEFVFEKDDPAWWPMLLGVAIAVGGLLLL
ncbi:DUF3592 domain-containing protein [Acidovorax sp. 1608163]|nr:DUF3592 domain-containing protein [Acidovorax sp. 1608163]